MKNINGYNVPEANEIRNAIKDARAYADSTGNFVQLWFDTIDGCFHKEEFVDINSYLVLPDYCYNIGMQYGLEEEISQAIEEKAKG